MNRTVLVTGASGGIGEATCQAFTDSGWNVIGVDRSEQRSEMDSFVPADIATDEGRSAVALELERHGSLQAIVNNAAVQIAMPLADLPGAGFRQLMEVNLIAAYEIVRMSLPYFAESENGRSIVNVSSVHALATSSGLSAYASSKGALLALTRSLAVELGSLGIRSNAVLPGAIETDMLRAGLDRDGSGGGAARTRLSSQTPLGRIGHPDEVARAILFLADEESSSFVTGQGLLIDGGATARLSTE